MAKKGQKGRRKRTQAGRPARRRPDARQWGDERVADQEPSTEKILRGRDNLGAVPDEASQAELDADVRRGRVISLRGSEALVEEEAGGAAVRCALRKTTRVPHTNTNALAVGDWVRWIFGDEEPHVIAEVEARHTSLMRVRRETSPHVIAANVDLAVIVASAAQPPFKPRLVDRYLVSAAEGGLQPVLALNKVDLLDEAAVPPLLALYAGLDVVALPVSAETGAGLDALIDVLRDKTAVFAGQSGVGKSSLINRLGGGRHEIETADVYGRVGKGRHTTTVSTLYRFPFGGAVIDTPGIRTFLLHKPSVEALQAFFPEVFAAAEECRFGDCSHQGDGGCALPAAMEAGDVLAARLDSFLTLMGEVKGGK